jgi:hypothetical protein
MVKASTRRVKSGRARGAPGASARKKPGTPMVSAATMVRCRGKNGYAIPAVPTATAMIAAYTVLVTNSLATRSMLAMTRRASPRSCGMAANVPSSSTTRATDRLASLPEPMAMPRSACLSACTSLTPSPIIATT